MKRLTGRAAIEAWPQRLAAVQAGGDGQGQRSQKDPGPGCAFACASLSRRGGHDAQPATRASQQV